jgi:hypothetical protein
VSKMSIEWHEDCLQNRRGYAERIYARFLQAQLDYSEARQCVIKYEHQIKAAKARGMDGFDADRFLKHKIKEVKP